MLAFENNLDNASKIVGLTQNDIDEFIENNSMFKSNDESKILDKNKVFDEFFQWKIEILIEIFTFKTVYNEDLIEFPKIFEIDENIIKKIDDSCKCKLDLYDMLEEISHRLSQLNLDVEEINEIIALDRLHLSNEYYMDKWIENLKEECDVYGN